MRRKGFTLTELMVVIGIIALLLAILAPSVSPIFALGRATICRNNLHNLGGAFATSANLRNKVESGSASFGTTSRIYPAGMEWPGIPSDAVSDLSMYRCPDDTTKASMTESLAKLTYVCPYGQYPMDTTNGLSSFYLARRGSDERGGYTEYALEDDEGNGQLAKLDFHKWIDTDGLVRVYDLGVIFIFSTVPSTPDFSGANCGSGTNTCGDLNAIYFEGQPFFGSQGRTNSVRGMEFPIPGWSSGNTNYGISNYAKNYSYGSKFIVLADSKELIINLDTPLEMETMLIKAARHLGRVNYLMGDGSVKTAWPLDISPRVHPEKWKP